MPTKFFHCYWSLSFLRNIRLGDGHSKSVAKVFATTTFLHSIHLWNFVALQLGKVLLTAQVHSTLTAIIYVETKVSLHIEWNIVKSMQRLFLFQILKRPIITISNF